MAPAVSPPLPMDAPLSRCSELSDAPAFADLAIYDDVLPSPGSPFRTLEYRHYLDFFSSAVLVSLETWHFNFAHAGFGDLRDAMGKQFKHRIVGFEAARDLVPRLAYVTFLGNAQRLLPYFQGRKIPFILQLYPGGSFEPNVKTSDDQLRAVVQSPLCRKVIATQKLTLEHLLDRIGCAPEKVELIYGGVFDSRVDFDFSKDKRFYDTHKDTIDLCFVAHRYGDDMAYKGYDQFVQVARLLAADLRLRFHVVGDYTPEDLPLGDAASSFTFYGARPNAFFADFYPGMDVILSVNHPFGEGQGAFDGFPTGACMEAGFRGVLNCVADPLKLNVAFEDDHDILLVDRNAERTAERLAALFATPDRLYALAQANWRRFHEVFDVDRQLWARTRLIVAELLREEALVMRPAAAGAMASAGTLNALLADSNSRHDALLAEYRKLAEGFEAVSTDYRRLAEGFEAVSTDYRRLAKGYEELQERDRAQSAKIDRLQARRLSRRARSLLDALRGRKSSR